MRWIEPPLRILSLKLRNRFRMENEVKIYIFFVLLPLYILITYGIIRVTNDQVFWILRIYPLFYTFFIMNVICLFPFFLYFPLKSSSSIPNYFLRVIKLASSLFCAGFFHSEMEDIATFDQIMYPLLLDLIISLLLVSSIFRNYKAWNRFFQSLQKKTRSFLIPKIFITMSVAFLFGLASYQNISGIIDHDMMIVGGGMLLLSIIYWTFRKFDFHLRKEEIIKIIPIQILLIFLISVLIMFEDWKLNLIIIVCLELVLLSASILCGMLMFYFLSCPYFIKLSLGCIRLIIKKWNYVQLEQTSENELEFSRDFKPTNVQIFYHFLFELSFLYILSSSIYMTAYSDLRTALSIIEFLLNNHLFIFFLPIYCFIFSLTAAKISWDKKVIKASILHRFLSIGTLLVVILKLWGLYFSQIYNALLNLAYSVPISLLIISGISFGFLSLRKYSVDRINKSEPLF